MPLCHQERVKMGGGRGDAQTFRIPDCFAPKSTNLNLFTRAPHMWYVFCTYWKGGELLFDARGRGGGWEVELAFLKASKGSSELQALTGH